MSTFVGTSGPGVQGPRLVPFRLTLGRTFVRTPQHLFPGGEYGPEHVNVEAQQRDPDSLLSWIRTLIERYRGVPRARLGAGTSCCAARPVW